MTTTTAAQRPRSRRSARTRVAAATLLTVSLVLTACGAGGPGASPTGTPGATSFAEFREAFCATWASIFTAVGNPDAGSGSELSDAFEAAIERGDLVTAEAKALEIRNELEAGRRHAAFGGAWEPAAAGMGHLDRLLVAFGAYIEAQRAAAAAGAGPAQERAQAAFEAAGGMDAWTSVLTPETWAAAASARPADAPFENCGDLPIGM
ncbi:MAG TPA: hypothetical protein VFX65_00890 [Candidatus Limnocylindrales bacterium]|nr:hypothetical protein [Candidatus Limnocylindrales bacterium]